MRRVILAAVLMLAAAPAALAQQNRMSDSRFIAASECLAYVDHEALRDDGVNVDALREATEVGRLGRNRVIRSAAEERKRQIEHHRPGTEAGVQQLREQRDAACARFVQQGLVQLGAPASS